MPLTHCPGVVVVVMAKTPARNAVKTRLQADVGAATALAAARAILLDTVDNAASAGSVVVAAAGDLGVMAGLLPAGVVVRGQVGADLAARLSHAQAAAFAEGAARVMLLGADCPTVGPGLLAAAAAALDTCDAALVPAVDGGYALLATTAPTPMLFEGIQMGTAAVAAQTRAAAQRAGIGLLDLPVRHDLDRLADFEAALAAGQLDDAPRTRALALRLVQDAAG
ncbi:TIGR04282 family arsenosugar biosynthesis glycosyltransferase [soil metagenome]